MVPAIGETKAAERLSSALNRLLLPALGRQSTPRARRRAAPPRAAMRSSKSCTCRAAATSFAQLVTRDELDVFFDEIEPRFEMREQFEQLVAQPNQWSAQTAGKLRDGDV